jgi:iron complex transport system substrate-binding protein
MKKILGFVVALSLSAVALPMFFVPNAGATIDAPQCIVSLSPTATATLYAIGAGVQVQAVDESSNFPAAAAKLSKEHQIDALNPNIESLLGICKVTKSHPSAKPDLVVISDDANSIQQDLTNEGVKVVEQGAATNVQSALQQIEQLGVLTGHTKSADAIAASMKKTINADIASVPAHPTKKISVYYEIAANPYYSLTSQTFVGKLMKSLGLVNIADADATSADAGYPELNAEYIVSSNPTLIFLAGDASVASVAKRSGFDKVSAVVHHNVIELNADIASQWGPRLVSLMNELTTAVKHVLGEKNLWTK